MLQGLMDGGVAARMAFLSEDDSNSEGVWLNELNQTHFFNASSDCASRVNNKASITRDFLRIW